MPLGPGSRPTAHTCTDMSCLVNAASLCVPHENLVAAKGNEEGYDGNDHNADAGDREQKYRRTDTGLTSN